MRLVISGPARLLIVLAAVGSLLAGCGSGPSRVGAAALIGGTRVPLEQVESSFQQVLGQNPGMKRTLQQQGRMDDLGRDIASLKVRHALALRAAREEPLAVPEQRVDDLVKQSGGPQAAASQHYTMDDYRAMAQDALIGAELGRKYLNRLSVTVDYTQASTRQEADAKVHRMAQGPEQAAAVLDSDSKAGLTPARGEMLRASDSVKIAGATPLFGAKPGTALAFELRPNSGQWLVARIADRHEDAPPKPAAPADDMALSSVGLRLIGVRAQEAGVRLSPRYGVWDPIAFRAAPNANETTGFWLDPKGKQES